ncbi:MAG: hypothetical protein M1828_000892 [Chrysothrix sp. TS-e1954]|nr:MAG: hypothetical protein M1828_000892 [Chrysothrix sp. TS-e1954]
MIYHGHGRSMRREVASSGSAMDLSWIAMVDVSSKAQACGRKWQASLRWWLVREKARKGAKLGYIGMYIGNDDEGGLGGYMYMYMSFETQRNIEEAQRGRKDGLRRV